MAETQQVQTHTDSARFKTAESGLCALKHALVRQGSRPPNQNARYKGAVYKLGKLSSRHRAHRAEAFRRKVVQMQRPPHGRDDSLFHFRITQCGVTIPDSACVQRSLIQLIRQTSIKRASDRHPYVAHMQRDSAWLRLSRFKHTLIRQGSRPPNQGCTH